MSFEHEHDIKVLRSNIAELAKDHLEFARCVTSVIETMRKEAWITSILALLSLIASFATATLFLYSNSGK